MIGQVSRAWSATMIRPLCDAGAGTRASFLRGTFTLDREVPDAVLSISALGLYRAHINGRRVGDDQLTPGWTVYTSRLSYQSYDVGQYLRHGENEIDIWLADGWMRSQMGWPPVSVTNTWGPDIGAIAEIAAGGDVLMATDGTWHSGLLPILKSGIYFGEIYDAREEGAPASSGVEAVAGFDTMRLVPHETAPVRELEPLEAVCSFGDDRGGTVYDFGQNAAGYVAFEVSGERGATVTVEHAEILDKDGAFYNENLRSAEARIAYTLKGEGVERYRPSFTFFGFRFARVTIEGQAAIRSIASIPISSAGRLTAGFSCGNPLVNRLVENTIWSLRSNFVEVPTDCPQRDERLGWTGDAQVFAPAACYLNDSHDFLVKWLRDVMADQKPDGGIAHASPNPFHSSPALPFYGSTGWGDAIVIVPWVLHQFYGDRGILRECLPAMLRWNDFVWSISDGPVVRPPPTRLDRGFTYGDWLQPNSEAMKALPTMGDDAAATIYLYISSSLIARIARLLGEDAIAERLSTRAEAVKAAFQGEFITPAGRLLYDDQSSYALAFMHGLIPDAHVEAAKRHFLATIARSRGRIGTGFIGTPVLLAALVRIGAHEQAGEVFLQEDVPGWLAQVKRGATTIWERWDGIKEDGSIFEPAMNSYNHYAYGAVCQWLFEGVAGFRPDADAPGFRTIVFQPTIIPRLAPVAAHYESAAGRIDAAWQVDHDQVTYEVAIPEGASGVLILAPQYRDVSIDGQPATAEASGGVRQRLESGRHIVRFRLGAAG